MCHQVRRSKWWDNCSCKANAHVLRNFYIIFFSFKKSCRKKLVMSWVWYSSVMELKPFFCGLGFLSQGNWKVLRKVYFEYWVFKVLGFRKFRFSFSNFSGLDFFGGLGRMSGFWVLVDKPELSLPEVPFYDLLYWVMYILQTHW